MKNTKTSRLYESMILAIILCGLETFCITDENGLRIFEERENGIKLI
jgi:hypothetical protein